MSGTAAPLPDLLTQPSLWLDCFTKNGRVPLAAVHVVELSDLYNRDHDPVTYELLLQAFIRLSQQVPSPVM